MGSEDDTVDVGSVADAPAAVAEGPDAQSTRREGRVPSERYRLLEPLGKGGAGVVYAAHDTELDRRVAIKLLRGDGGGGRELGTDARQRLIREARALARVAHPNVAHVYDVGEYGPGELQPTIPALADDDELPAASGVYLVMELVDGESLRRWLARGPHPWAEVLRVMRACGHGLAAAHMVGLVHRDFKPGNVLLGSDARIRVVDFGLARAGIPMDSVDSGSTPGPGPAAVGPGTESLTRDGTILGTPAYMAPEQHRGETATAAADQFAFCVVLYQAICGRRPFKGHDLRELQAQKESESAVIPVPAAAAPGWIWPILKRGLAADPTARFPSMADLLHAIDGRVRQRRRRVIAAVATPAVAAGIYAALRLGGSMEAAHECEDQRAHLVGVWDAAARAEAEQGVRGTGVPYAAAAWESLSTGLDEYVARWTDLRGQACLGQRASEASDLALANWTVACLDGAMSTLTAVQEELARATPGTVESYRELLDQLPALDRCGDIELANRELLVSGEERRHRASIERKLDVSEVLIVAARFDEALSVVDQAAAEAAGYGLRDMEGRVRIQAARALVARGDPLGAEEALREAIVAGEEHGDPDIRTEAEVLLLHVLGGHEVGIAEADRLVGPLEARVRRRGKEDKISHGFFRALGSLRDKQARHDESLRAFELARDQTVRVFGKGSAEAAQAEGALGLAHFRMGHYTRAREYFSRAHAGYQDAYGDQHPATARALSRVALALSEGGERDAAINVAREAAAALEATLGPKHRSVVNAIGNLAVMLHKAHRDEEALQVNRRAMALEAELSGREDTTYGLWLGNQALILRGLGRPEEALASLQAQLAIFTKAYPPEHPNLGLTRLNTGSVLRSLGRLEEAEEYGREALRIYEAAHGERHDAVAQTLGLLCLLHLDRGRIADARAACRRGLSIYESLEGFEDLRLLGELAFGLAQALPRSEAGRARALALRAHDAFVVAGDDQATEVRHWLDARGVRVGIEDPGG